MFLIKKIRKQNGFTIIEIVVSSLIIALLSGIFLVNYRSTDRQSKLNMAAQKVVSDIRLAQNFSLGLQELNGSIPKSGWGVRFEENLANYIIFADNDEGEYDYDAGEKYKTVDLPKGIEISFINVADIVDVVFMPPNPTTYINQVDNTSVEITLRETTSNTIKTIRVNFLGLVDIIN